MTTTARPITREFCKAHRVCYYEQPSGARKGNRLIPAKGLTLMEAARLDIPPEDVVLLFTRPPVDGYPQLLPDSVLWEWSARTVERALSRVEKPDPRSLAVVPLLRRLAEGEKIPQDELAYAAGVARNAACAAARNAACAAAWAAAWAAAGAAASDAARAARAAAGAARNAACAAAWAAAGAAERKAQVEDLIALLEESK